MSESSAGRFARTPVPIARLLFALNQANVDARGVVRPQRTQCDLGAVEVEGSDP